MKNKIYQEHRNALPGPDDITRFVLPNGIILLFRPNFNSPTLSIKGYLHVGSFLDTNEKMGVSYLTAQGLMNGTANHDLQALYNEIESIGAQLGFSSGTMTTSFSAHCLSEDLRLILGLISESLQSPSFPLKDFNRQKNQLLTALAIRAQDTSSMASILFDQIVYANHPYERPEEGFPNTVRLIQRDDLVEFYQNNYGPKEMVIAIVGAVEAQVAVDAVSHALGEWENRSQQLMPKIPNAQAINKTIRKTTHIPGKFQSDIVMGSLAPERNSPDYQALRLGNNILGEFGMMGRLGKSVREENGLAYYVYSSLSVGNGPGAWEMIAGVNPKNVNKTIKLIKEEVKRYVSEPVSEDELSDTKSNFLGRMPLIMESNSGVAVSLLNLERFNLGLNYFRDYPQQIQSITPEEILAASQKYLDPERLAIAVAGP
jgi:zinc protease